MANEKRLIDANALIAELRKSAEYHEKRRLGYYSAIDHIREQPTVDAVEVVHGRWIWSENGELDYEQYWLCSECGDSIFFKTNYCPNCGARMDGDGNAE